MSGLWGYFLLCDSGKSTSLLRFAHVCSGGLCVQLP